MTGVIALLDQPRTLDALGNATTATIYFYNTGTTTLAAIYEDANLATPAANPVELAAGEIFPTIYLNPSVSYRRRIVYGDGTVQDVPVLPDANITTDNINFTASGTGAQSETLSVILNREHVWPEQYSTMQQAFDAAVSRKAELHFQPNKTYNWPSASVVVTGKVSVYAVGARIECSAAITMLEFRTGADDSEITGGEWVYTGSLTSGYNAGSNAILIKGSLNGAGVAPTFIDNVFVRNATFDGFGNVAVEYRYARNCGDENIRVLNCGYAGVFLFSVDIYRSTNLFVNTLAGQLDTGVLATSQLNAYGITATALTGGTPDRVQNPRSRDIVVDIPTFFNIPTWHAADSHGSDQMIVKNATIVNCRRGVVFTALSDVGSSNCKAINCTATNNFAANAVNGNSTYKKGEAFWDIGASTSNRNSFNSFLGCYCFGHGDPSANTGAITIGDANDGYYQITDEQSFRVGWKFAANISRGVVDARSTNTRSASVNPSVARIEGNDIDIRVAKWRSGERNASVDTNVMVNGIIVVSTNTGGSIHFEDFDLTDCTAGEILSNSGSTIAATLTGNYTISADITLTGITATVTGSCKFVRRGPLCFMQTPESGINGTSNTNACTLIGVPASFRPSATTAAGLIASLDNSNYILAHAKIDSGGVVTLTRDADNNTSAWTNAGLKGVRGGQLSWII